jgi:hypothetical protein
MIGTLELNACLTLLFFMLAGAAARAAAAAVWQQMQCCCITPVCLRPNPPTRRFNS